MAMAVESVRRTTKGPSSLASERESLRLCLTAFHLFFRETELGLVVMSLIFQFRPSLVSERDGNEYQKISKFHIQLR